MPNNNIVASDSAQGPIECDCRDCPLADCAMAGTVRQSRLSDSRNCTMLNSVSKVGKRVKASIEYTSIGMYCTSVDQRR